MNNNSFEETNNSKDKGKPNDAIDLFKMNNLIFNPSHESSKGEILDKRFQAGVGAAHNGLNQTPYTSFHGKSILRH